MSSRNSLSIPQSIAKFFENYGPQTSSLAGSILLAISGLFSSDQIYEKRSLFIVGVFLAVTGGFISIVKSPGYKDQQEKIRHLESELRSNTEALDNERGLQKKQLETELSSRKKGYSRILNDELKVLTQILNFGETERISLYTHDRRDRKFIMVARHSSNPRYKQPGRVIYPENQGCIGRVWEQSSCFVELPEPETPQYFQTHQDEFNMDRKVVESIVMKSRTIGGISIDDRDGEKSAIIIFESTRSRAFRENVIKTLMNNCGEARRITFLLARVGKIEPDLIYAYEEGF